MLAVTFAMFAAGWMGGGDAKLAAGIALWLGFADLLDYCMLASILGGVLTLALLAARRYPLPLMLARIPWALRLHAPETGIPYGIALALAALAILPTRKSCFALFRAEALERCNTLLGLPTADGGQSIRSRISK